MTTILYLGKIAFNLYMLNMLAERYYFKKYIRIYQPKFKGIIK